MHCIKNLLPISASVPLYWVSPKKLHIHISSAFWPTLNWSIVCWDLKTPNRRAAAIHFLCDEWSNTFQVLFSISQQKTNIPASSLLPTPTLTSLSPQRTPDISSQCGREMPQIAATFICLINIKNSIHNNA